jgi:hypothetical protein
LGELVDQCFDCIDFVRNRGRTLPQDPLGFGVGNAAAVQVTHDPLRAQGDRRQRILDLMSDPPRYFVPGGGFLGPQEIARIFQNQHESRVYPII